jgi:hypothetical protein
VGGGELLPGPAGLRLCPAPRLFDRPMSQLGWDTVSCSLSRG